MKEKLTKKNHLRLNRIWVRTKFKIVVDKIEAMASPSLLDFFSFIPTENNSSPNFRDSVLAVWVTFYFVGN